MVKKIKRYYQIFQKYFFPKGSKLAYIGGVHGTKNLGDEALRLAADKLFANSCLIDYPRKAESASVITRLFPITHAVLAGGTLINQREIWLDVVKQYSSLIPNFFVFGTGVGNPVFWNDRRKEWVSLLNEFHYVGVRGPLSAQLLSEAGVINVEVIGDPALVFAEQNFKKSITNKVLGLNFGWDRAKQWGNAKDIESQMLQLATKAKKAGWQIKWFVVCPNDFEKTKSIANNSSTSQEIIEAYTNPYEFIKCVKECNMFLGMRLHSVVLAICGYVPSIMLEYRPKCRDFMMSIDQGDMIIRTDKFNANSAWDKINVTYSKYKINTSKLFESVQILKQKQSAKAQEIQNWINQKK